MSGFDDRRGPTNPGRPAGPPTAGQQPIDRPHLVPVPAPDDADATWRPNLVTPPIAPDRSDVPPPSSQWQPGGYDEPPHPAVTPWQRGGQEQSSGHDAGQRPVDPNEHAPTSRWQPEAGGAPSHPRQPDPTMQWPPNDETAPTLQWRPGGQSDPATSWAGGPASNTSGQADPTMLSQSLDGPQPGRDDPTVLRPSLRPAGQWPPQSEPTPVAPGRDDPTMLGQPLGALDQPAPFGGRGPSPGDAAPTLLGYPSADRFGRPAQTLQWQPPGGPGQYGAAPGGRYQPYGPHDGFGGPPPQPNRPGGSGKGKIVLSAGLAVLLVAGLVAGAVALTTMKTDDPAQAGSPSMVNALTTTAGSPARTTTTTKPAPTTTARGQGDKTPLIPGYQVVRAPDSGAAYDVPADWTIAPQNTIGGFGEPPNAVVGKGLASEGKGYCPGSTRTVAFLTGSDTSDPGRAATELGTRTATLAYKATPGGTPGLPMPLASLDGSQHGMFVETKGTVADAKPGCAKAYSVYTAAFPNDNGTFVMVIAADTGVPNALDAETAKRIFTSIRPLAG
ncbi:MULTISPECIES: hypothetical protein [Nocardia]|uniref:hypothetical protein n=1 Tax=Nocardia TaxID=1817 RepID=UPI00135BB885|nr:MULTISPECIES: hypothetical protein [Nocardia]